MNEQRMILLPDSVNIDISRLSRLFDNMSECYKLFWFQAIVNQVAADNQRITFDTLINDMIADSWYMVSEYRLNLGPSDTLEALVHYAFRISGLKSSEKRENILKFLHDSTDRELLRRKRTLTYNVPFRLQAPFLDEIKGKDWSVSQDALATKINQNKRLIYYFVQISGLDSKIEIQADWMAYIKWNQGIIRGWIQYNLAVYLQKRNPSVPGITNKLYPPQDRKLERVKRYWKSIMEQEIVCDIYGGRMLTEKDISMDHFVPWSYVAHDELWNLSPTTRSINSQKSNGLPEWDTYFSKLCQIEYQAYEAVWKYQSVHKEFDRCMNEHVNNEDIRRRLYRSGLSQNEFGGILEEIITPVYQSAQNMGFAMWHLTERSVL